MTARIDGFTQRRTLFVGVLVRVSRIRLRNGRRAFRDFWIGRTGIGLTLRRVGRVSHRFSVASIAARFGRAAAETPTAPKISAFP